jgi:hypothetical protein
MRILPMLPASSVLYHSLRMMFCDTIIVHLCMCSALVIMDVLEELLSRDKTRGGNPIPVFMRFFPNE